MTTDNEEQENVEPETPDLSGDEEAPKVEEAEEAEEPKEDGD